MQKDLKIGMLLGLVTVIGAALWVCTRPSLSTKARMLDSRNAEALNSHNTTTLSVETKQPKTEQRASSIEPRETRFHTVREGETLSDISYRYYGSANKWQKILNANRKIIKDANRLRPGTRLIIPE